MKNYLHFPLPLLRSVLTTGAPSLDNIIYLAIYRVSTEYVADINEACAKILEVYLNVPEKLPEVLAEEIAECFEDEREYRIDVFTLYVKQNEMEDEVICYAKLLQAAEEVGIGIDLGYALKLADKYKHLLHGQVPVSVDRDMLFRLKDSMRTEYDRVRCAMYLAVRSLAANGVAITTQQAIQWRTFGCRNQQELDEALKDVRLSTIWKKWTSRYYYRHIIDDLIYSKLILQMPYSHHTCITASIVDDEKFVDAVAAKIRRMVAKPKREKAKEKQKKLQAMLKAQINTS